LKNFAITTLVLLASLVSASPARAETVWNETTNGDLSGNGNAPTQLGAWGAGTHSVLATSGAGDVDDFTFTIPAGLSLSTIVNSAYAGIDGTAFIGIANGATVDHAGAPASLIGYQHFGPNMGNVDSDLLAFMGGPLGPGTYSVWWQQIGSPSTVQLDFTVVPEPGSAGVLALAAVAFTTARTRRARPPK
jgi:hypothetical protein